MQPATAIVEHLGVDPKSHARVAGGDQFGKDPLILVFAIDDLEMPPAEGVFAGGPFRIEQVRKLLFLWHRRK